jgi:hypothetical protein
MKLGEKLKQTLNELEQARIKGLEAQAATELEKVRKERAELEMWINSIRDNFIAQINASRVPYDKIYDYTQKEWIRKAINGSAPHSDLWSKFRQFWNKEGLAPIIEEEHDGLGVESWINITLTILPPRPRNFATGGAYEG